MRVRLNPIEKKDFQAEYVVEHGRMEGLEFCEGQGQAKSRIISKMHSRIRTLWLENGRLRDEKKSIIAMLNYSNKMAKSNLEQKLQEQGPLSVEILRKLRLLENEVRKLRMEKKILKKVDGEYDLE